MYLFAHFLSSFAHFSQLLRQKTSLLDGLTNGALKMTRRLRMAISQKLASWKGSAEDAKAGLKPLYPLWLINNL